MNVRNQKILASKILKKGRNRIVLDQSKLSDIKEAITKQDIRSLIEKKVITAKHIQGQSRSRARKHIAQKRKGKRKNSGSRKGSKFAHLSRKTLWMNKVRTQRKFIKGLKGKKLLSSKDFRDVYQKIKSNRFRTIRLIKVHIEENNLIKKNDVHKKA